MPQRCSSAKTHALIFHLILTHVAVEISYLHQFTSNVCQLPGSLLADALKSSCSEISLRSCESTLCRPSTGSRWAGLCDCVQLPLSHSWVQGSQQAKLGY